MLPAVKAFENFSGQEAVTLGIRQLVGMCLSFDRVKGASDPGWDFLTDEGYKRSLGFLMAVEEGGLHFAAPSCDPWVWVVRYGTAHTQRETPQETKA